MTTYPTTRLLATLLLLLLTTACGHEIVGPDPTNEFTIASTPMIVSASTMEGTFEAQGAIADRGRMLEVLDSTAPLRQRNRLYGTKTLEGAKGTIELEFYTDLSRVDGITLRAKGGFRILQGTGAYAKLEGSGEIDLEVNMNASPSEVTRVLEGFVEDASKR